VPKMNAAPAILLVDDDEELCEVLQDILQAQDYATESAHSGLEAEEKLKERKFNLAFVDIRLPDMTGTDLVLRLKQIDPDMEIIILTAYATLETSVRALRNGVFDYVMKPFSVEEIMASIKAALEKQQAAVREMAEKEHYRALSIVDSLTGLYNRRHFQELLAREIARARRYSQELSLLMIDIDHFKKYQDRVGHVAGDQALRNVGQTLLSSVRGVDAISRYGGEEFAIIMPETGKEQAAAAAKRTKEAVAEAQAPGRKKLTVSIGIANYPEDAKDEEQLVFRADQALYQAKQAGRNRIRSWRPPPSWEE